MGRTPEGDVIVLGFSGDGASPRDQRHEALSEGLAGDDALRILVDVTELDRQWPVAELFTEMEFFASTFGRRVRGVAAVAVDPTEESVHFWETTAVNHGLNARAFADRDAALTWLRAQ